MDELVESIRASLAPEATSDARAAGAAACRTILVALEGAAGEPLATAAPLNAPAIANAVAALRGVPPDQLLDLAIAKLRSALPAGTAVPPVAPLKFHIVPFLRPAKP